MLHIIYCKGGIRVSNCNNGNNNNNNINNELNTLLSSQLLTRLALSKNMRIAELDAIIAILIKTKIPFDVQYSPGTRRLAESAQLTIYINPTTTISFNLNLETGPSLFSGTTV